MVPTYNTGGDDVALLPAGSGYHVTCGELRGSFRDVSFPGVGGLIRRLAASTGRTVRIAAVMRATAESRTLADQTLSAAVSAIEELKNSTWTFKCDAYPAGLSQCTVDRIAPGNRREYARNGDDWIVLQDYAIQISQLAAS